jgi:glycosyltransferase involved in cell wall biosynthesis
MRPRRDELRVAVAQIGARRHYAVPVALYRAGKLEAFHTDWCANRGVTSLIAGLGGCRPFGSRLRRLQDRRVPDLPAEMIHPHTLHAVRMAALRRTRRMPNDGYWEQANATFGRAVVREGFGDATAVYAFNAAAVEIFAAARDQGLMTILDQTMAPWAYVQQLLDEERRRWPDWSLPASEGTRTERLAEREAREWELADLVICGSQFVVDAIRDCGGPEEKCRVVPYGYDAPQTAVTREERSDGPLRVLFVGTVDLRKGVPYLLEAARRIDRSSAQFRMVGPIQVSEAAVRQLSERIEVCGPQPRSQVMEHYQWADILVLPTLAEGSANVCFEALANGVPVVTTPSAGSVVRNRVDGWIIPPRSAEAIVTCIKEAHRAPEELFQMSACARTRAQEFTWGHYMEHLAATVSEILSVAPAPSQLVASAER